MITKDIFEGIKYIFTNNNGVIFNSNIHIFQYKLKNFETNILRYFVKNENEIFSYNNMTDSKEKENYFKMIITKYKLVDKVMEIKNEIFIKFIKNNNLNDKKNIIEIKDDKILIYEKNCFEGTVVEIDGMTFNFLRVNYFNSYLFIKNKVFLYNQTNDKLFVSNMEESLIKNSVFANDILKNVFRIVLNKNLKDDNDKKYIIKNLIKLKKKYINSNNPEIYREFNYESSFSYNTDIGNIKEKNFIEEYEKNIDKTFNYLEYFLPILNVLNYNIWR